MKSRYDVIVIGGGITGLIAAYGLIKRGKSVAVFERAGQLGGVIRPFKVNGRWLEGFYHHLFNQDTLVSNLVKELGLEITWHITKTAFHYSSEESYELSSPIDLFRFHSLSLSEKMKLARFLARVYLPFNMDYLVNFSAEDWLIASVGKNIYKIFFEPMLRAKFGKYANEIGADWFLGRLKIRSGRTWAGERLGYIQGGFGYLVEKLAEEIENGESKIYLNSEVSTIITEYKRVAGVFLKDGKEIYSDCILSTVPPETLLKLVNFPDNYDKKIKQLEYQGSICVVLAMEAKLTEYYWINVMDRKSKFNALIEHTNFQSIEDYGEHIFYLASYPDKNSAVWNLSEEELIKEYFKSLKAAFPSFRKEKVKWAKIFCSNSAGLIYRVGIKKMLPDIQTPFAGLFIGGMFNAHPKRSINACAQIALECVDRIIYNSKPLKSFKNRI